MRKGKIISVVWKESKSYTIYFFSLCGESSHGKLKFMLPNKHSVYLHDTPMKSLFNRSNRRFSHGCIRVERPIDLAEFVFNDDEAWNGQKVQNAINSGVSNNIYLKQPIPVHILYFTVWVENDNSVHFRNDVYNFFGNSSTPDRDSAI